MNGFDDPQACHVDDRDVIRNAVCDHQIFLVRRKGTMPNSLADQQILQNGMRDAVNHRHPIGRPEGDEAELAISRDIDADGLDGLRSQAWNLECHRLLELAWGRIDDRQAAADFRGYP